MASESEQIRHLEEMKHRLNLQLGAANRHAAASAASADRCRLVCVVLAFVMLAALLWAVSR